MRSRILIIAVALVLGGVAAVFAAQYLNSARSQIQSEAKSVQVLVAQQDIPLGTPADELFQKKLVAREDIPQLFVASGAISSARAIDGQVLAMPLSAGEQLTVGRFQFPSEAGLAYKVPEDYVAISIPVDKVSGVSGFVKPGDNVALMATVKKANGAGSSDGSEKVTKTLVSKARVLAVGTSVGVEQPQDASKSGSVFGSSSTSASHASENGPDTVTLALSPKDAERVVFVQNEGAATDRAIWIVLLPIRSTGVPGTSGQTLQTVLR